MDGGPHFSFAQGVSLGLTYEEIAGAVKAYLPPDLFPGGAKAGWWTKTVQLDLEAKGVVIREAASSQLHWRRAR